MFGFQAAGAAPLVEGRVIEHPETVASAIRIGNPVRWEDAMAAATDSRGAIRVVSDEEILGAYRLLASREGMFCEPASAASVAGLLKYGAEGAEQIVCVLTGRGLKDPETAIANNDGRIIQCSPSIGPRSRRRCWVIRRRVVRVPASSANLGPGFDCMAAASACTCESRCARRDSSRSRPTCPCRAGARTCACRRSSGCTQPTGSRSGSTREIPLAGGLGSSAAAIVAGLMAADHLFELDADLLALASEIEGHPDNVAAALNGGFVVCADGQATRFDPPTGLEAIAVVPEQAVATRSAREALPEEVPLGEAVFNVAHAALLTLGLSRGDWDLVARGLHDSLHQARRASLFPRSYELALRARELGALGATISGAGPTVLVWCFYEQTGAVVEALRAETEGWASLLRAPFEAQGAYVGEL